MGAPPPTSTHFPAPDCVRVHEKCVDFIFHSAWSGEGEWKKQPQITDLHTDVSKLGNEPVMIERNPRRQLFYVKWGLTRYWQAASYFMPPLTRNCGGPCIKNGERGDWHGSRARTLKALARGENNWSGFVVCKVRNYMLKPNVL